MTRDQMRRHAEAWIAAWNNGDVDRVLVDFADDARFLSPRAQQIAGQAELRGKAALGAYWRAAMAKHGRPRFRLDQCAMSSAAKCWWFTTGSTTARPSALAS